MSNYRSYNAYRNDVGKMAAEVPLETLNSLKCALCNEFLTVPPIMIISKDALQNKCGRCHNIETEVSSRNIIFEKLAELSTYPCTFSNCKQVLKWCEVEKHEEKCVHKTLRCPVSWNCDETISIAELNQHCLTEHKKNVFNDELVLPFDEPLDKNKITVVLLIKKNSQFLVFRVITSENIWVKVFSFLPVENCKYAFEICNSTAECCLSYKNPIELYLERKHCKKCVMNDCDNILHTKTNKKLDEIAADYGYQKIDKDIVKELKLINLTLKIIYDEKQID